MYVNKNTSYLFPKGWITQAEAARLRKVSPTAISRLLRQERLRSKKIAGRRLVYEKDVLNFKPRRRGVGRPSKSVMQTAEASVNRDEWITQTEAAKLRKFSLGAIQGAISKGRIRTLKNKSVVFVRKEDVRNYRPRIDFHPEAGPQSALPPGENPKDWITVAEAARLRGVNQATITRHAISQRIRSIKTGDTRLVYREDILNFKRKPGPGRPKKK